MPLKKFRPITPGLRYKTVEDFDGITAKRPERSLCESLGKIHGRNHHGHVTIRNRGGGHKRLYRKIDFKRNKDGIPAKVRTIEYDPNRSSRIALVCYLDGEKRYILAPNGLQVGDMIQNGPEAEHKLGNTLALRDIVEGTVVHNVELKIGGGGKIARGAGTGAQLLAKEGKYALLRMPSSEIRKVHLDCRATIGQVGNLDHENITLGKAGRKRWLGWRPKTRGVAMNPVDHPLGGGEGKSSGGRHPVTPWGKPCKGHKTRNNKRTDNMIVNRRSKK